MSETVNLPELGESVTEGTVTRWLKEVGDSIEVDEPIVEVSTDKVDTEIPSPVAGTLLEILVDEDETVEVGQPLAKVGDSEDAESSDDSDDSAEEEEATEETSEDEVEESSNDSDADDQADEDEDQQAPAAESGDDAAEGQEVTLPELGESVSEGTVTRWLKEVGDEVEVDEALLEISTDKVDTEIPSPVAGTLLEIKVDEDETAEVGDVLAIIGSGSAGSASTSDSNADSDEEDTESETSDTEDEQAEEEDSQPAAQEEPEEQKEQEEQEQDSSSEPTQEPKEQTASAPKESESDATEQPRGEGYVTPLVRRLARQNDIELSEVVGTGVGGRIRKQDVLTAVEAKKYAAQQESGTAQASSSAPSSGADNAPAKKPAPSTSVDPSKRGTTEKASRTRQVIAERMLGSLQGAAQLTQVHEVDMTRIVKIRNQAKERFKAQHGVNLTFLAFIAKAAVEALQQHPVINAEYDKESKEITYHDKENIGIAVDNPKGLMVPVIKNAGQLNLTGIATQISELAESIRSGKFSPDLLAGGTFSITNLGSFGALFDSPVLNAPQSAILGPGNIVKRPMVIQDAEGNDTIAIRHMMYLALTYDHQIIDGADAGRFMQTLKARLEEAEFGAELGL